MNTIKIAVADDHVLFRKGLCNLIRSLNAKFEVVIEANNGEDLFDQLKQMQEQPEIIILDVNMPILDGFETAKKLKEKQFDTRILVLTMHEDEETLIKMLRAGVHGYLGKDVEPDELKKGLEALIEKGYHYTDLLTGQLIKSLQSPKETQAQLKERELAFIELACSEDTYDQIADKMCVSPKTVDGYRAAVFEKLGVRSRVGLAIYAIKEGIVKIR